MRKLMCRLGIHSMFWQHSKGGVYHVCRYCEFVCVDCTKRYAPMHRHAHLKTAFDAIINYPLSFEPTPGPVRHRKK